METLPPGGGAGHSVGCVCGVAEQLWVILLRQAEECGPVLYIYISFKELLNLQVEL